ncbi:hypothetical protein H1R20_g1134, partial [Candolleomyces eurysporus]
MSRMRRTSEFLVFAIFPVHGSIRSLTIHSQALYTGTWGTEYDWKTTSVPTENVGPIYMPRGKALGGSTNINLMQLGRAPSTEYDALEAWGNPGWTATEFNKYFKKSQTLAYNETKADEFGLKPNPALYGSGPILNTLPKITADVYPAWAEAYKELGVPFNPTADGGENLGVWPGASAIHNETVTRITSATAYYGPNKGKRNLKVITSAHVSRIVFGKARDGKGLIATGVEYIVDGTNATTVVHAKKEVILSAGSLMTPQILELSGIGDPKILILSSSRAEDHPSIPFVCEVDGSLESFDGLLTDKERLQRELNLYESREGLLTTVAIYFSFLNLPQFAEEAEKLRSIAQGLEKKEIHPEIKGTLDSWLGRDDISQLELIMIPFFVATLVTPTPSPGKSHFSFTIAVMHPFSRGSVHISSTNPLTLPTINLSWADNDYDIGVLVEGVKLARRLIQAKPLAAIQAKELAPGPSIQTDDQIVDYARQHAGTTFHPLGTAAMLPREKGGVVDHNLRVYGTKNLRVVDASIIPVQIGAHPTATIYAIAEKAADLIKSGH